MLLERHSGATYVPHQRYVIDRGVTTTGITAAVPTTLALVEAIGSSEKAQAIMEYAGVATELPGGPPYGYLYCAHIGRTKEQIEIRRVDRGSLDAHDYFVILGFRDWHVGERNLQNTISLHRGIQLQRCA
jgi:hypothetical protein